MFDTSKGCDVHLRATLGCKDWISLSKRRAPEEPIHEGPTPEESSVFRDNYVVDDFETENNIFHWIDATMDVDVGKAGPGPSTVAANCRLNRMLASLPYSLAIDKPEVFSEPHKWGGKVLQMAETMYEKWRVRFRHEGNSENDEGQSSDDRDNIYSPFVSKLDWGIVQWAVQENVGQAAFDRLLKIPGVLERLQLSYKNSRYLNKIINSIPARGSQWKTKDF
ncbi:hypothetical protein PM082_015490 [Marasmius tenuissimus]|nr:hypothetical protein PM082_015490 [Marasmius tenuissimus]